MLFMKVKKVRHSSPIGIHHTTKNLYNTFVHPMSWEPLLNKNTVQIRAKFARSLQKIPGQWSSGSVARLQGTARSSQHVPAPV